MSGRVDEQRRVERERDILPAGLQAHGQRVDRGGQAHIGRAVRVDVVAQDQRPVEAFPDLAQAQIHFRCRTCGVFPVGASRGKSAVSR